MGPITTALLIAVLAPHYAYCFGEDGLNNLFSDLGPLLSLFGEQVAKQYISQSMGVLDNIIFALAPLGIITAIVAAIRVGGPQWLKAVVGRARENIATVELELMSSTSHEVGEAWNGTAIVRTLGSPSLAQIVYIDDLSDAMPAKSGNDRNTNEFDPFDYPCGLYTLEVAEKSGYLRKTNYKKSALDSKLPILVQHRTADVELGPETNSSTNARVPVASNNQGEKPSESNTTSFRRSVNEVDPAVTRRWRAAQHPNNTIDSVLTWQDLTVEDTFSDHLAEEDYAPDISLNLQEVTNQRELYFTAATGIVLQAVVLAIAASSVYHPELRTLLSKDGKPVASYAFPLLVLGSLLQFLGLFICTTVIDKSTEEYVWARCTPFLPQTMSTPEPPASAETLSTPSKPSSSSHENTASSELATPPARDNQPLESLITVESQVDSAFEKHHNAFHLMWLQKKQIVNDQTFKPTILIANHPRKTMITSNRKTTSSHVERLRLAKKSRIHNRFKSIADTPLQRYTLVGTVLAFAGFVLQFQALRGLNWTISLAQFIAMLVMTVLRSVIRRGLILPPTSKELLEGYELDWLSTTRMRYVAGPSKALGEPSYQYSSFEWLLKMNPGRNFALGGSFSDESLHLHRNLWHQSNAQRALMMRRRLGKLTGWDNSNEIRAAAEAVCNTIEALLEIIQKDKSGRNHHAFSDPVKRFTWSVGVTGTYDAQTDSAITLDAICEYDRSEGDKSDFFKWSVDLPSIEAAISLCLFQLARRNLTKSFGDALFTIGSLDGRTERDFFLWCPEEMLERVTVENRFDLMSRYRHAHQPDFVVGFEDSLKNMILGGYCEYGQSQGLNSISEYTDFVAYRPTPTELNSKVAGTTVELLVAKHIFSSFLWAALGEISPNCFDLGCSLLENQAESLVALVTDQKFAIDESRYKFSPPRVTKFRFEESFGERYKELPVKVSSLLEGASKTLTTISKAIIDNRLAVNDSGAAALIFPPLSSLGLLPSETIANCIWNTTRGQLRALLGTLHTDKVDIAVLYKTSEVLGKLSRSCLNMIYPEWWFRPRHRLESHRTGLTLDFDSAQKLELAGRDSLVILSFAINLQFLLFLAEILTRRLVNSSATVSKLDGTDGKQLVTWAIQRIFHSHLHIELGCAFRFLRLESQLKRNHSPLEVQGSEPSKSQGPTLLDKIWKLYALQGRFDCVQYLCTILRYSRNLTAYELNTASWFLEPRVEQPVTRIPKDPDDQRTIGNLEMMIERRDRTTLRLGQSALDIVNRSSRWNPGRNVEPPYDTKGDLFGFTSEHYCTASHFSFTPQGTEDQVRYVKLEDTANQDIAQRTPAHILASRYDLHNVKIRSDDIKRMMRSPKPWLRAQCSTDSDPHRDLCFQDLYGYYPMHYAARAGNLSFLRYALMSSGPKFLKITDACGWTTLHVACFFGQAEAADLILRETASRYPTLVDKWLLAKDAMGMTAVDRAMLEGHHKIAMDVLLALQREFSQKNEWILPIESEDDLRDLEETQGREALNWVSTSDWKTSSEFEASTDGEVAEIDKTTDEEHRVKLDKGLKELASRKRPEFLEMARRSLLTCPMVGDGSDVYDEETIRAAEMGLRERIWNPRLRRDYASRYRY